MKKITLLVIAIITAISVNAQFTYTTVKTDGFETTDGLPTAFTRTGQSSWSTASAPYTGTLWDLLFASTAPKDYTASVSTTEFHSGAQSLKITTGTTTVVIRLRSISGTPFTTNVVDWAKYRVTVWAKGSNGSQIFDKHTQLASGEWDKYVFVKDYSTGTSETRLMLDLKATGGTLTTIYLDDVLVEQYTGTIPSTTAAGNITSTGFTANWSTVPGASGGYRITLQTSADGGTTWTSAGSAITVSDPAATSYVVTSLAASTLYQYKVEGFDGTYYTPSSNFTQVTTNSATGVATVKIKSAYAANGNVYVELSEAQDVEIFNTNGQRVAKHTGIIGLNTIAVNKAGLYIVKSGNEIKKIILN